MDSESANESNISEVSDYFDLLSTYRNNSEQIMYS